MSERVFPIHPCDRKRFGSGVPWSLVESHQQQAIRNHSQTLERLAERGGLSVAELYALCHDERLPITIGRKYTDKAESWFSRLLWATHDPRG